MKKRRNLVKKILILLGGFVSFFNLIFKIVWIDGYQELEGKYSKHVVFVNEIRVPHPMVLTIDTPRK